ncbi:hypothetical protein ABR737_01080 [Streptomyces sp. Edi2]|uniref:hypothetical protein n=1 Tax=Streptomyces sp. Edi2 TaxID=3162528 RepID=UPI003305B8D1
MNHPLVFLTDSAARVLLWAADKAAARSRVPNPILLARVTLHALALPDASGADFYQIISESAHDLGFIWGRCAECGAELGLNPYEEWPLCQGCEPWVCACAFENPGVDCGGCHLTRAGQGECMPPCTCGCDTAFGRYGDYDTESSVSRQHFIDTGRFLRPGEALDHYDARIPWTTVAD